MLRSVVAVVALVLLASPAYAFRPSTKWLLDRAAERSLDRGTKTLKVEASVTFFDASGAPKGEASVERVWVASPGNLRREIEVDGGLLVEIRADGKTLTKMPGQPDKPGKAGADLLVDLIALAPPVDAGAQADKLIAAMKGLGVNTEVVAYARFDGRVAYLVGSKPWETDKPQVWLDKDTFLPMRVVTFLKGPDGNPVREDVRYLGWGSPVGGNWYPQSIEIWRAEKLVRRSVTQSVERNVPIDANQFALR